MTFATKLESLIEELEQIREDAYDFDANAVADKITEALGPLTNALGSARSLT